MTKIWTTALLLCVSITAFAKTADVINIGLEIAMNGQPARKSAIRTRLGETAKIGFTDEERSRIEIEVTPTYADQKQIRMDFFLTKEGKFLGKPTVITSAKQEAKIEVEDLYSLKILPTVETTKSKEVQ